LARVGGHGGGRDELYLNFKSVVEVAMVMLTLPFALVDGVWFMWMLGYNPSAAVAVGFIALAGVPAQTGVVMLLYLEQAYARASSGGLRHARLLDAIDHGAANRVRPKLMTVAAIMAGLLPLMWAHGTGASVMRRIRDVAAHRGGERTGVLACRGGV
jgi:Cu(I)/Ag(I) efflux system membrane protein CusA/SilA